jgi:heme-degrading monooxygenase HmoA
MIAVLFEVQIAEGGGDEYLRRAAELRPEVEKIDGFISIERFQSLADPTRLLSLSWWRDEESIARWRAHEEHRRAQGAGRAGLFADYRIRVAELTREYGMRDRRDAPARPGEAEHTPRRGI